MKQKSLLIIPDFGKMVLFLDFPPIKFFKIRENKRNIKEKIVQISNFLGEAQA